MGFVNIFSNIMMGLYINNNYKTLVNQSIKRENTSVDMVKKLDENFNTKDNDSNKNGCNENASWDNVFVEFKEQEKQT